DIGLMSRELVKHEETKKWFTTWQTTIRVGLPGKPQTEFGLTNTNRLIKTYDGANGIKTGFTQEAGYCLSASATRGELTLIAVILGAATTKERFAEAATLLDYGFANYDAIQLAEKGTSMGSVALDKAIPNEINGAVASDVGTYCKNGKNR
ncbi:MAG: D-alanyl-D-alanine carboxypeptidase, partial [Anaerovorax sp.]